ncbi:MAG TPA: tripartite tricarboxylate transporter substrate-binding protein [Ramlibacter sp.]|nr:tripartite tricarboxylate transporter substrate-binding protein [Ramlibacter sp.]
MNKIDFTHNGNAMRRSTLIKLLCLAAAGSGLWAPMARAQAFPERTVTLVVPFPAGTPADIFARALAEEMQAAWKQAVIVDNKPGAGQAIGASYVARAPADGHTLLLFVEPVVFPASAMKNQPFAGMTDFEPVAHIARQQVFLAVGPGMPAANVRELIALLKQKPGKYTYGSAGIGTPLHLYTETFHREVGATGVHVPYKSYQGALADLLSGRIDYNFLPVSAMEFVKQGKLKALALATPVRDPDYPDLITLSEAGLKGADYSSPYYLVAPKGTPAAIVSRLNAGVNAIILGRNYATRVKPTGGGVIIPSPVTPLQAGALIAQDETRWKQLVKALNIDLE